MARTTTQISNPSRSRTTLSLACVFPAVLFAGCGDSSQDDDTGTGTSTTTGTTSTSGSNSSETGSTPPNPYIEYDGLLGVAQNPFIRHVFTADPSARVFDGRVYVYASHDLDDQEDYRMTDYHVFSSDDLVNWQDHGVALDVADVSWARYLYAPDAAYSPTTGKYYLYFPDSGRGIGVAVSDSPTGPFVDALGAPLVNKDTPGVEDVDWVFDPSVFVDDDGQPYLYFGGGLPGTGDNARVIRLGDDMISLEDASATTIVVPDFFEAAFVHKREGKYYLSYSTTFENHSAYIDYMVSDAPMAGWTYGGTVLPNPPRNQNNNNHHSIAEFDGRWLVFYHNRKLAGETGYGVYQRSITMDELTYDAAGNIVQVEPSLDGSVTQVEPLDAFVRIEAELMADQRGLEIEFAEEAGTRTGVNLTDLHTLEWSGYSQVDFGAGATAFKARVASASAGGTIEIYLDGCDLFTNLPGVHIGSCAVGSTGGWQAWVEVTCAIAPTQGVHDLYLRYAGLEGEPLFNFDAFQFETTESGESGDGTASGSGSATGDESSSETRGSSSGGDDTTSGDTTTEGSDTSGGT